MMADNPEKIAVGNITDPVRAVAKEVGPGQRGELTLADFESGDPVRYVPLHVHGDASHPDCEDGKVSGRNDKFVFVRFKRPDGSFKECPETCTPGQLVKLPHRLPE